MPGAVNGGMNGLLLHRGRGEKILTDLFDLQTQRLQIQISNF